jgi:hypothetical protein
MTLFGMCPKCRNIGTRPKTGGEMFEKDEVLKELHARLVEAGINPLDPKVQAISEVVNAFYAEKTRDVLQKMQDWPNNLYRDLAFFRSALRAYQRFKFGNDADAASSVVETADEIIADEVSQTFALERDMQAAIRGNIKQMGADLSIVDNGSETLVEAGSIDILTKDASGNSVVIELKAGTCRAPAVAQILAYMGCISDGSKKQVKGILVAGDFEKRVQLAAKAVPNLTLKRYSFRFEFSDV